MLSFLKRSRHLATSTLRASNRRRRLIDAAADRYALQSMEPRYLMTSVSVVQGDFGVFGPALSDEENAIFDGFNPLRGSSDLFDFVGNGLSPEVNEIFDGFLFGGVGIEGDGEADVDLATGSIEDFVEEGENVLTFFAEGATDLGSINGQSDGLEIRPDDLPSGGLGIRTFDRGDFAAFNAFIPAGTDALILSYASVTNSENARLELRLGDPQGEVVGRFPIESTDRLFPFTFQRFDLLREISGSTTLYLVGAAGTAIGEVDLFSLVYDSAIGPDPGDPSDPTDPDPDDPEEPREDPVDPDPPLGDPVDPTLGDPVNPTPTIPINPLVLTSSQAAGGLAAVTATATPAVSPTPPVAPQPQQQLPASSPAPSVAPSETTSPANVSTLASVTGLDGVRFGTSRPRLDGLAVTMSGVVGLFDRDEFVVFEGLNVDNAERATIEFSSESEGGQIQLRAGDRRGPVVAAFNLTNTGDDRAFQTLTVDLQRDLAGVDELFLIGSRGEDIGSIRSLSFSGSADGPLDAAATSEPDAGLLPLSSAGSFPLLAADAGEFGSLSGGDGGLELSSSNGIELVTGFDRDDFVAFRDLDLDGVTSGSLGFEFTTQVGRVDLRLGDPRGEVLATFRPVGNSGAGAGLQTYTIDLDRTLSGTDDLFVIGAQGQNLGGFAFLDLS